LNIDGRTYTASVGRIQQSGKYFADLGARYPTVGAYYREVGLEATMVPTKAAFKMFLANAAKAPTASLGLVLGCDKINFQPVPVPAPGTAEGRKYVSTVRQILRTPSSSDPIKTPTGTSFSTTTSKHIEANDNPLIAVLYSMGHGTRPDMSISKYSFAKTPDIQHYSLKPMDPIEQIDDNGNCLKIASINFYASGNELLNIETQAAPQ
jgi:hypothetical protein